MTAGLALTLRLLFAFWTPTGSAYNVDAVLAVMVAGLQDEISDRKTLATRNLQIKQRNNDEDDAAKETFFEGSEFLATDNLVSGHYYAINDPAVDEFPSRDASPD
mmetsp:Transcript_17222/g.22394  ORF Transcript_17222/g.22394 Transcript_17222/m.22394 type:complete len:105 (-) Transcript_17222:49-363(-)